MTDMQKHGVEVQAIFNYHVTAEHALETLELIEPNSCVFKEGVIAGVTADEQVRAYDDLIRLRCQQGVYDAESVDLIRQINADREQRNSASANHAFAYGETLFNGLVAKNCVIVPADYVMLPDSHFEERHWQGLLYDQLAREGDAEAKRAFQEILGEETKDRESAAIEAIHGFTEFETNFVAINPKYVVYGAMHRVSLTRRLTEAGISVQNIHFAVGGRSIDSITDLSE